MSELGGGLLVAVCGLLIFPYYLTRWLLHSVVQFFPDPAGSEARAGVRWTALICLALTVFGGLAFTDYCYQSSLTYRPTGWIDLGKALYQLGMWLPLGPLTAVLLAVAKPVSANNLVAQPWET